MNDESEKNVNGSDYWISLDLHHGPKLNFDPSTCDKTSNRRKKFVTLNLKDCFQPRGLHYIYSGYGDVPSGRVSFFQILV